MPEILGPRELAERGLDRIFDPPSPEHEAAVNAAGERAVAILRSRDPMEMYVPEADVTETLPDGRTIQIAVAGAPMPMSEARKAGLVKDNQQVGPSESKPARPAREAKAPGTPKAGAGGSSQPENPPAGGEQS